MKKLQAPSSSIQKNTIRQAPSLQLRQFETWRLEFLWYLDVGAWCFTRLCFQ